MAAMSAGFGPVWEEAQRQTDARKALRARFATPAGASEALGLPPPPAHYAEFDRPLLPDARRVVHAFTGAAKTTWAYRFVVSEIVRRNPPPRILYVTVDPKNARDFGGRVMEYLEGIGLAGNREWGSGALRASTADPAQKEPTLRCQSTGTSLEGWRGDIIVLDDPFDREVAISDATRRWFNEWFENTLLARPEPGCVLLIMLSPWHPEDFSMQAVKRGWERILLPAYMADEAGRVATWPEKWPLTVLDERRRQMDEHAFRRRYLCDVDQPEGADFRREWLDAREDGIHAWVDEVPETHRLRATGWDFAVSKTQTADYTAGVTIAYNPSDLTDLYVVDIVREKIVQDHEHLIRAVRDRHEAHLTVVEAVQFQRLIANLAARAGVPVSAIKHHREDKRSRLLRLQTWFREGHLRFLRSISPDSKEAFYGEYLWFYTEGHHDDILDALQMVVHHVTSGRIKSLSRHSIGW